MTAPRLILAHTRLMLLDLLRSPAYLIPTIFFPTMFFLIFAVPNARQPARADFVTLSFVAFAIIGVTLFQFGVGIAAERGRPWERYLRTLPAGAAVRFAARIACALAFGLCAAALVAITARLTTPMDFGPAQWMRLGLYAVAGAIPFVLFGIAIGYWVSARAALPIANIFYLLLSFAGGLWMPPRFLPGIAATISPYLPTRQFGELLWSIVGAGDATRALPALAVYSIVFAILAAIGYRRDERTRYA